jgi:hypothetical protein
MLLAAGACLQSAPDRVVIAPEETELPGLVPAPPMGPEATPVLVGTARLAHAAPPAGVAVLS